MDGTWWIGIFPFTWISGGNWIIGWFRHGIVANEIAEGIDELIFSKTQLSENDK